MWIDDETGALLKLTGVDARGAVVYFLEVERIEFDRGDRIALMPKPA